MAASSTQQLSKHRSYLRWIDRPLSKPILVGLAIVLFAASCSDAGENLSSAPTISAPGDSAVPAEPATADSSGLQVVNAATNDEPQNDKAPTDAAPVDSAPLGSASTTASQTSASQPRATQTTATQPRATQPRAKQTTTKQTTATQPRAKQTTTKQTTATQPRAKQTTTKQTTATQPRAKQTTTRQTTTKQTQTTTRQTTAVTATTTTMGSTSTIDQTTQPTVRKRPPGRVLPGGNADYQIGGAYPLPQGVSIVLRDRSDSPASGAYNICYINGFQTQPSETSGWAKNLLLQNGNGKVVIDPDWDEALLDITTPEKRKGIAAIVGGWIKECARKGFDAVEIDNLDTYSRSGGRISQDHAVAMMATYSSLAHSAGLDIAQKNSAEIVNRAGELGTDFAVVEGCSRYNECSVFTSAYGRDVIMVEYRDGDFKQGCDAHGDTNPIVLRDRNVSKPGSKAYVFRLCP